MKLSNHWTALRRAWKNVSPYLYGVASGTLVAVYVNYERYYILAATMQHLVWVWGLSAVFFYQTYNVLRLQRTFLTMTNYGFVAHIRGGAFYRQLLRLHSEALWVAQGSAALSLLLSVFYYVFPVEFSFPIWFGLCVCTYLLMLRANMGFTLAQATYSEVEDK